MTTDTAPPPAGHNNPPPYDPIALAASAQKAQEVADAAASWLNLGQISSADESQMLTDFVAQARAVFKAIDEERATAKKPHDDAGKAVQKAYSDPLDVVERCVKKAKELQADWLKRENARIEAEKRAAAEEAARKRAEAEAELARAAMSNDIAGQVAAEKALKEAAKEEKSANRVESAKAGSASGGGRTMALRKVKVAVIESRRQVMLYFHDQPEVIELLQRLATAAVRKGEEVPGVRVEEHEVAA